MSEGRKISTRKIIQTLVTIVLLGLCVFVMLSASKVQEEKKIKGIRINIYNEEACQFVTKEEIKKALFDSRHIEPKKISLKEIDLKKMESILQTNPWIKNAQVFVDNRMLLNIVVTQRMPQLRVFDRVGNSYYIDSSKTILPLVDNYNHYELLFINVPEIKNDSIGTVLKSKLISIAKCIKAHKFWHAQTSQIIFNSIDDIQLIPILGNQKILLGDASNLDIKLENLLAFYQKIENKIGWDKYEVLDARFENQIVASPSLPWNMPIDRALTNMNWVKTIVGDIPAKETTTAAFPLSNGDNSAIQKTTKDSTATKIQTKKNNSNPL